MAKKIRFPLIMEDGVEVRSMEELRENFSLVKVLEYKENGKLVIWLRDRYATDIASEIEQLDDDEDLAKKVSEIFDIPFDDKAEEELEIAKDKAERVKKLKQYTDEEKYIEEIDNVAFSQDDLFDLLDEGKEKIYLCGDKFDIPLAKQGVTYIGINNPIAFIDSKVRVDWSEKQITLENVVFDEKYNSIKVKIGDFRDDTFIHSMLDWLEKAEAKQMYKKVRAEIETLNYDFSGGIEQFETLVEDVDLALNKSKKSLNVPNKKFGNNTALALIFDYNSCNEYAKIVMDKSTLLFHQLFDEDIWHYFFPTYESVSDAEDKKKVTEIFIYLCNESSNIRYKFIFWALLAFSVDRTEAEKHLSLICSFAARLHMVDCAYKDIMNSVKFIFYNDKTEYEFGCFNTRLLFEPLVSVYGN